MMKTKWILLSLLLLSMLLCGCGSAAPAETAVPAPAPAETAALSPTPAPTPEPTPEPTPTPVPEYTVDLGGVAVRSTDTEAVLEAGNPITPQELSEKLKELPNLETLDIMALNWKNEDSLLVRDENPGVKLIWPVHFMDYTVPSNITCFSTLPRGGAFHNDSLRPLLTYCTDLVALDIGHQPYSDLEPLRNLKKLKVLILADDWISDISPLSELTELEYLELFMNSGISDFTPLNKLTKMKDLNLCYCYQLKNLDFLDYMPDVEMAWFSQVYDPFPEEMKAAAMEAHPDCTFLFATGRQSTGDGWRKAERNIEIRRAFMNWRNVENFISWDNVVYKEGVQLIEVGPKEY